MEYDLKTTTAFYNDAKGSIRQCMGKIKSTLVDSGRDLVTLSVIVSKEHSEQFRAKIGGDYRFELTDNL